MVLLKNSKAINLLCYHFLLLILISNMVLSDPDEFKIDDNITIEDFQNAFRQRKLTSKDLVQYYLNKIDRLNPKLRCVLETNPFAMREADDADRERERSRDGRLGDMHGIPVLVRDTMSTKDAMNTTCGSYALLDTEVRNDAGVVEKLKRVGAIILGKSSMTEWRMRSSRIPTGWNARGGQALNPYVLESKGPCGTSSGTAVAVAAGMATVAMSDSVDRGLLCTANYNSVVGMKTTRGLTSRSGVIMLPQRTGTTGIHAKRVADVASLLDNMAGYDEKDAEATLRASKYIPVGGYKQFLKKDGLSRKRIGVLRRTSWESDDDPTDTSYFDKSLQVMRDGGAALVDKVEMENMDLIMNSTQSGAWDLLLVDFKMSINNFLKTVIRSRVRSLTDVISFNRQNADLEKIDEYGQDYLMNADRTNGYGKQEIMTANMLERVVKRGFEKMMIDNKLDAVVTPGYKIERVLSMGGYPGISVPEGYGKRGVPNGVVFAGLKGSEPTLIEIAFAYEQATMARKPPPISYSD